ncbi:hypothetical protein LNQ03_22755 [Klebsiella pneumoniae subsp. pneumoniae]|nr:hypothetical protein [Klebsiella pneumoniae subsp. pneumoniae]
MRWQRADGSSISPGAVYPGSGRRGDDYQPDATSFWPDRCRCQSLAGDRPFHLGVNIAAAHLRMTPLLRTCCSFVNPSLPHFAWYWKSPNAAWSMTPHWPQRI